MLKVAHNKPPPACNTGVEKKSVSQSIHWLEVTFKSADDRKLPDSLSQEYVECHALHGYNIGSLFSDGRKEFTHSLRPDMGLHIQWDGGALDRSEMPVSLLVEFLYKAGATFTRIDLAVDVIGHGLKPKDATNEIENGRHISRAKKCPAWFDPQFGGHTQYIGTKASEIFVRIYDKAAEMGRKGDHTRVEIVLRKSRAIYAAGCIVRGEDFRPLVLGFIRFPEWELWNEVMGAEMVTIQAEKKESATKLWLLKQCAKSLARVLDEDGDDEFWFRFLDAVNTNRVS